MWAKNTSSVLVVIAIIFWIILCTYWYVCHIKGQCSVSSSRTTSTISYSDQSASLAALAVDVKNRPEQRITGGSSERRTVTTINRQVTVTCPVSYLNNDIRYGANNIRASVRKLEMFLNDFEDEDLDVDGYYDRSDLRAVERFQQKYAASILTPLGFSHPTGDVMSSTRRTINQIYCAAQYQRGEID